MPDTQLPENNICHEGQSQSKSNSYSREFIPDWFRAYDHYERNTNGGWIFELIVPGSRRDES